MLADVAAYAAVTVIGAAVGAGELISRYKDRPSRALRTLPALGYIGVNAVASAGALGLIFIFGWSFGAEGSERDVLRTLVAGFGAMALFRTSLFTVRAGDRDIGIGPSGVLTELLASCDRGVDRSRAKDRAVEVLSIMGSVSYEKAKGSLPAVALALMQNLGPPEQAALGLELERLDQYEDANERAKALLLGLAIANAVGPGVLQNAVTALGSDIHSVTLVAA